MRHRKVSIVVIVTIVLSVLGFACSAVAQVTVQKRTSTAQHRDVERIRELRAEIEELMSNLPPNLQAELRTELGLATVATTTVAPISPVDTATTDDGGDDGYANAGGGKVMVLDTRPNGFDFGGRAKIRVGGWIREARWVRPGTDDAFLMIDGAGIRSAGFELFGADGEKIKERVLVSSGVRLRTADGKIRVINDPWDLLGNLDTDGDGNIDQRDATWRHLSVFLDGNGDGRVHGGEIHSLMDFGIRRFNLQHGSAREDSRGNTLTEGTYERTPRGIAPLAGVTLRR